jgi:hypothetical protein
VADAAKNRLAAGMGGAMDDARYHGLMRAYFLRIAATLTAVTTRPEVQR